MIRASWIGVLIVAAVVGVASYYATVSVAQRSPGGRAGGVCPNVAGWLSLTPAQQREIEAADPAFREDCRTLRRDSDAAKDALAEALTRDDASDSEIRDGVERTIETHNRLERRVTEHLLKVRSILTPEQRRRLLDISAEQVRQGRCGSGAGRGMGPGRGLGGGQGSPWHENEMRQERSRRGAER